MTEAKIFLLFCLYVILHKKEKESLISGYKRKDMFHTFLRYLHSLALIAPMCVKINIYFPILILKDNNNHRYKNRIKSFTYHVELEILKKRKCLYKITVFVVVFIEHETS